MSANSGPLCVAALVEPVSLALCVDFINDPVEHGEHTNTDVHQYYGARAINNIYIYIKRRVTHYCSSSAAPPPPLLRCWNHYSVCSGLEKMMLIGPELDEEFIFKRWTLAFVALILRRFQSVLLLFSLATKRWDLIAKVTLSWHNSARRAK
jgi:hypothetical protein